MRVDSKKRSGSTAVVQELQERKRADRKLRLLSVCSVLAVILIWQALVSFEIVNTRYLASPIEVFQTLVRKFHVKKPDGNYLQSHILASARVVFAGYFASVIIGIPLGLIMGWSERCDRIFRLLFEIVRPIPALAWIPIVILFLGVGDSARSAIIFFGAFVVLVLNAYAGIRSTKKVHLDVGRTCGLKNRELFWKVGVPSAMPMVFSGLKIALSSSWATVVSAEMLAAGAGLGFLIQMGRSYGDVSLILTGILVIGLCGFASGYLIELLERVVLKWTVKK